MMKRLNETNDNNVWDEATRYHFRINVPAAKAEPETTTAVEAEPETVTVVARKHRRRRIYWGRIAIASTLCLALLYGGVVGIKSLFNGRISTSDDSSSISTVIEDSSSTPETSSNTAEKQVVKFSLSEDEFATLVLAVEHECGLDPTLYLTLSERARYTELTTTPKSAMTQELEQEIFGLEELCIKRYNRAQQLTAASMLNRIGKRGFGVNGYDENGKGENLFDVLEQPGQFSIVDEDGIVVWSLLDNISNYAKMGLNPCDNRTIENCKAVIYGKISIDSNLVYEISHQVWNYENAEAEAEADLKNRTSWSGYICSYEQIPCSYQDDLGNWYDYLQVFGINETGSGYSQPLAS